MPKPPIWNISRITTCPKPDQYVPVSTTTRPVTATALVAVKKAVISGGCSPLVVASGFHKSNVPIMIAVANSSGISRTGSRVTCIARRYTRKPVRQPTSIISRTITLAH